MGVGTRGSWRFILFLVRVFLDGLLGRFLLYGDVSRRINDSGVEVLDVNSSRTGDVLDVLILWTESTRIVNDIGFV